MSSIYVQIGQCGCQIGAKLNKKLSTSYYSTRIYPPNKLHAIMIDTQPKVLKPFIDNPPKWLDVHNVKYFQYGRGNNWSYGYMHELPLGKINQEYVEGFKQFSHLTKKEKIQRQQLAQQDKEQQQQTKRQHKSRSRSPIQPQKPLSPFKFNQSPQKPSTYSPKKIQQQPLQQLYPSLTQFEQKVLVQKYLKQNKQICEYTLQRIRKQLDCIDCPLAINVLCSLGGGTGSGLGTKMIEKVYEQFNMDIYAHVVLPNKSGQTPLQIYNCTLSLASIQEHSTGIFTYENDKMINTFLPNIQSKDQKFTGTDLDFINENISDLQARLFRINDHDTYNRFYHDLINQCILSNQLKYLSLFGAKTTQNTTECILDSAFDTLCQQLRVYNEELYQIDGIQIGREKCLANNMIVMTAQGTQLQDKHRKKLRNILNPCQLNPQLNIQYIGYPKKQATQNPLNMSKISTQSTSASSQVNQPQILLLINHSNIVRYLQYLSVAGRKKYDAKAYLWHYKYADLQAAFNQIQSVIDHYVYTAHQ